MSQNTMSTGIAEQIAQQTLAKRGAGYVEEVRRLLDAALAVMRAGGPDARARVADIVAAAGLSNDAFYRHFPSKDALVAAADRRRQRAPARLPRAPDGEGADAGGSDPPLGRGRAVAGSR